MGTLAGKAKPLLRLLLRVGCGGGRLHRVNLIRCTPSQPYTAIAYRFGSPLSDSSLSPHASPGSGDE
jgi:hypothetical protein